MPNDTGEVRGWDTAQHGGCPVLSRGAGTKLGRGSPACQRLFAGREGVGARGSCPREGSCGGQEPLYAAGMSSQAAGRAARGPQQGLFLPD